MAGMTRTMEGTVLGLIGHIKANIDDALEKLRDDRAAAPNLPAKVNLTPFLEYHVYPKVIGLRTPALCVLGRTTEYLKERGQNHVNGIVNVQVSAIFQDRTAELVTFQSWRYADVLYSILDGAQILSVDGKMKNIVLVTDAQFGDAVEIKSQTDANNLFRKEVMLILRVEHYETQEV